MNEDPTPLNFDTHSRVIPFDVFRLNRENDILFTPIAYEKSKPPEAKWKVNKYVSLNSITDTSPLRPRTTLEELEERWDSVKHKD